MYSFDIVHKNNLGNFEKYEIDLPYVPRNGDYINFEKTSGGPSCDWVVVVSAVVFYADRQEVCLHTEVAVS